MGLQMTPQALEYTVRRTADFVEGAAVGTRFSGDHLNALCRAIARIRLREELRRPTEPADVDRALSEWIERPRMTPAEERVVATHEAGHAVCALFCTHATPIERISIQGDAAGTLGFVRYQDPAHRYVVTRGQLLDDLCILMGGRESELLLLDDLSIGSSGDLQRATSIARALVEEFGMGGPDVGVCRFHAENGETGRYAHLSPAQLETLDRRVRELLEEGRQRASKILSEQRSLVETLRDLLLQNKVLDAGTLANLIAEHQNP
jgi:cell division protease FtsH